MKTINNFHSIIVDLKDEKYLQNQRYAGSVVAKTLSLLQDLVKQKTTKSLLELNYIAEEFIVSNRCIPTFKNYAPSHHKPFPYGVCMSVNKTLVHGIPNDYKLQDGDLISFDLGCTYNEAIADSAITCVYGDYAWFSDKHLVQTTYECLMKSISSIKIDSRIGIIGETIHNHAKRNNFNVIDAFGGHGIGLDINGKGYPHGSPFVRNKSTKEYGIRFQKNMTIAIEPLLTKGDVHHKIDNDGWGVVLKQNNAHFEHSIFIHEDSVEILTLRQGEVF